MFKKPLNYPHECLFLVIFMSVQFAHENATNMPFTRLNHFWFVIKMPLKYINDH